LLSDKSVNQIRYVHLSVTRRDEHNKIAEELFEECLDDVLDDVLKELSSKGFAFTLKAEQRLALRHLFDGKDVLAVLSTGFGKSLIFQLFV